MLNTGKVRCDKLVSVGGVRMCGQPTVVSRCKSVVVVVVGRYSVRRHCSINGCSLSVGALSCCVCVWSVPVPTVPHKRLDIDLLSNIGDRLQPTMTTAISCSSSCSSSSSIIIAERIGLSIQHARNSLLTLSTLVKTQTRN